MSLTVRSVVFTLLFFSSNSFGATTLIFPRIVSGNGWKTRISVRSLSPAPFPPIPNQALIEVFDENGVSQEAVYAFLPTDYDIQSTVNGWVRVTALGNIEIDGSAFLQNKANGNQFQVLSVDLLSKITIPLASSNDMQSAVALLNPSQAALNASALFYGTDGSITQASFTLGAGQEIAKFVRDIFPTASVAGQVVFSSPSSNKFAALVLQTDSSGNFSVSTNIQIQAPQGPAGLGTILTGAVDGTVTGTFYFTQGNLTVGPFSLVQNQQVIPVACTVDTFVVNTKITSSTGTPASGWSYGYTLFKNGSSTSVSCSQTWGTALGAAATCFDTNHTTIFNAGDVWTIQASTSQTGTPPAGRIAAAMRCR